ncbi:DNA gyrase subunit A [Candidatus Amarolinea aalborgensis]|uniref:DNA gyrase subunit A n=1 Tax=Candidatus Amarolinea aalborgensis TaxID=2249329 RepID=UPI003BF9B497
MTIGTIRTIDIDQEMQTAYLDYAMSVIVARALPDVRDGLKPVHRRILYAMHDMGLTADKTHKKSARIVGEVLGKYHPHGDAAVYESMVRMAQDFSLRYMLVDGQGNFGSVDGDNAAAMRYTEARLARIASSVLDDIDKDTVEFGPNFDESLREPTILPALLPNLLVNGASGIAVGMSTNVPPHNLGEVCDALVYLIDHYERADEVSIEELMQFIQGPDFPTGGLVFRYGKTSTGEQEDLIAQSYAVGRGRFVIQAKAHLEEMSRNRNRIVVTELPYMTNKTRLLERIAELVREGRLDGISDLRDESDRTGMRVAIELTRTVDAQQILNELFRLTPMQQTFSVSLLALVDGEPRLLSLKKILIHYVEHRREIIRRRTEFDLARARARAHIVEGLLIALKNLDEVIQIIRSSRTTETARANLMKRFQLSEIQAQAILDMPLKRLAQLERQKLEQEYKDLLRLIAQLEALLASQSKMLALIQDELRQLKATYGDARRTQIVERAKGKMSAHDLLPDQDVWLTVTRDGMIARRPLEELKPETLRSLAPSADLALLRANTRHYLALFSRDGRSARLGLHQVNEGAGSHWADLSGFTRRDRVAAVTTIARNLNGDCHLVLVSRQGKVKRITLTDFLDAVNLEPTTVFNLDDKDELGWVMLAQGSQEFVLVTRQGQAIRFKDEDVRPVGLPAGGVNAVKLARSDQVIYAGLATPGTELLTATELGYLKRSGLDDFPTQGRAGSGVVAHSLNARSGELAQAAVVAPESLLAVSTNQPSWHVMALTDVPLAGRNTQGKLLLPLAHGQKVSGLLTVRQDKSAELSDEAPLPRPEPSRRKASQAGAKTRSQAQPAASSQLALALPAAPKAKSTPAAPKAKSRAAQAQPRPAASTAKKVNRAAASVAAPAQPTLTPAPTSAKKTKPAAATNQPLIQPKEPPPATAAPAAREAKPAAAPVAAPVQPTLAAASSSAKKTKPAAAPPAPAAPAAKKPLIQPKDAPAPVTVAEKPATRRKAGAAAETPAPKPPKARR